MILPVLYSQSISQFYIDLVFVLTCLVDQQVSIICQVTMYTGDRIVEEISAFSWDVMDTDECSF